MDASMKKANDNFAKELEDELLKYPTNYEEDNLKMDASMGEQTEVHKIPDAEVNITECAKSGGIEVDEAECQDTAENSSSFAASDSGVESGSTLGDTEVVPHFHDDVTSALDFDGFGEIFKMRKKKLTIHWRSFIQPLMWRCKWAELQIKKFQSQAQKYDRELAEYTQPDQFQSENFTLEGLGVKSFPFSCDKARGKVLKRKKRRRNEATTDVAAYMSRHNLFSYFENRKSSADGTIMGDELRNPAIATEKVNIKDEFWANDEQLWLESGDGGNSLEDVLRKIGILQSKVRKLKDKVGTIMSENAGKISLSDDLSWVMPGNGLIDSTRNPASPPNNGYGMPVGSYIASQLISEYKMGDIKPESSVLSFGDVPDVIESTDQSHVGGSCKNAEDVLIDNKTIKEEMINFEELNVLPIKRTLVLTDGLGSTIPPVPAGPSLLTDDQPPVKLRSVSQLSAPKNKRKRSRRKGSSQWSRRP